MLQDTEQGHLNSCGGVCGLLRGGEGSVEASSEDRVRMKAECVGSSLITGDRGWKEHDPRREPVPVSLGWVTHRLGAGG